ncbi:hypothetical protein VCHENC02_0972B, partial [Vibrio harveyi]
KKIVWS